MIQQKKFKKDQNLETSCISKIQTILSRIYKDCVFIDTRLENDESFQNKIRLISLQEQEIKNILDKKLHIDTVIVTNKNQIITQQDKCRRFQSWTNKRKWVNGLPCIHIRNQRKVWNDDMKKYIIMNVEFFKIMADHYFLAFLNETESEITEWVMLDTSIIKNIISQANSVTDIGTLHDEDLYNQNLGEASSYYSFPIHNIKQSIITGSQLFQPFIWLDCFKNKDNLLF